MAPCYNCKNSRRQLLKLSCKHDTCIRCAADNYFINCKNKLNQKSNLCNNYFCENCLEQTPLDARTLEELKKYFMENIIIEEKHRQSRKEKIRQREHNERERLEQLGRLDVAGTSRPKSLQVEMDQRKRTLSKYLDDKKVEKFMQMQKEYGVSKRERHHKQSKEMVTTVRNRMSPQVHTFQQTHNNEYELKSTRQYEAIKKRDNANMLKQKYSDTDSFDRFADRQQLKNDYARIKEYQNRKLKTQHNDHRQKMKRQQQEEYELYHNGKAVPNYNPKTANRILEQGKISQNGSKSRYSSSSSARAIGKIMTKKSIPSEQSANVQSVSPVLGKAQREYLQKLSGQHRNERLMSASSEQRDPGCSYQGYPTKAVSIEYNYKNNCSMQWEIESKSTRKVHHEKTVAMAQRNSDTMQQILETLEVSDAKKESVVKMKERSLQTYKSKEKEKLSSRDESQKQRHQTYFCKIHQDEEIIYFCLKCSQLICSQCALHGSHKQHEIHSLKKSAQLLKQNLVHNMSTLNKMLIEEETKEKVLKQCINELSLQCNRQKQQIKSSFENFIFAVDKKYKDLLKEIEDKFSNSLNEYNQKLNQSRNSYIQISQIKDDVSETLQECGTEEEGGAVSSETSIAAACNQFGNFHIKKQKNKQAHNQVGIEEINKLITRITELSEFLKNSKETFFSPKKGSLISEPSSLKLSESSNLLQDKGQFDFFTTPATNTPQRSANQTPKRRSKRIVVGGYGLSVKNRIRLCKCQSIVQSLVQMQQIVRAIKLDSIQYQVRALS